MKCCTVFGALFLVLFSFCYETSAQEAPFELPVQLVGFPFIVGSVKLTNFFKKLSYSLSPAIGNPLQDIVESGLHPARPCGLNEYNNDIDGYFPPYFACTHDVVFRTFAAYSLADLWDCTGGLAVDKCDFKRFQNNRVLDVEINVHRDGYPNIVFYDYATYRSRNRRQLDYSEPAEPFDADEVEKYIVGEFGAKACVFERVCAHYANRARAQPRPQLDWPDVFRQYKRSADQAKEFYLLSVFMGDIVGSPLLCHQLGKRRGCDDRFLGGY